MKLIRTILPVVSCLLGIASYFLVIHLLFSTGEGLFSYRGPRGTIISVILLAVILAGYSAFIYFVDKREESNDFLLINIALYFMFFFGTPVFQFLIS